MSRYVNDITTSKGADEVQRTVSEFLTLEGFQRAGYGPEEVWRKGSGVMMGPQFIKVAPVNGHIHLEAWVKYAILPWVTVGEMGTEGLMNAAPKRKLKARVEKLEQLLG